MKWSSLALPVFVTVLIAVGIMALVLAPVPQTAPVVESDKPPQPVVAVKPLEESTARDVSKGAVPTPVFPTEPLERIAPTTAEKPREVFGPPMPVLGTEQPYLLFQPIVESAGTLMAEGRRITLIGVLPVEPSRICTSYDGTKWPCGKKARTEFRALVRGRAISCLLPDQQKTGVETECSIGEENLGEWLVEYGWAEAKPGSDLENLGQAAKLMGRGIFGRGT